MARTRTKSRRTQEERRTAAEEALLDAAMELFAERGVDSVSIADIADSAGFSRGLVNHHFGSRAALVERLARRTQTRFIEQQTVALDDVDAVAALVDSYLLQVWSRPSEARAFLAMWGSSMAMHAPLREIFADYDRRSRDIISSAIRAARDSGTFDDRVAPEAFAVVLIAVMRGVVSQYAVNPDAVDLAAARATVIEMVRGHLSPRNADHRSDRSKGGL